MSDGILEETEEKTMEDTNLPAPSCDANDELNRKLRDNFDGKTPAVESEEIENRSGKNYGDLFQYQKSTQGDGLYVTGFSGDEVNFDTFLIPFYLKLTNMTNKTWGEIPDNKRFCNDEQSETGMKSLRWSRVVPCGLQVIRITRQFAFLCGLPF